MKLLPGNLLVSSPELLMDHVFNQSVVLMVEHNKNGSMGFIINKALPLRINDIFEDIPSNIQIWNGGPVETANLFYLHNTPHLIPDSILFDTSKDWYIGGNFERIKTLLKEKQIDDRHIKFFLGYAGWSPGQLEQEFEEKAWYVAPGNLDLFDLNPKNLWKEKIVEIDPKNIIWKNAPLNPHLN